MILLTGATGTSGSEIAKQLSGAGASFRALVRDPRAAGPLSGLNVELAEGDLGKPETLKKPLEGIDHALLLSSPDERQVELQGNFIEAAKSAGVNHVVKFSAIGAAPDSISKFLRWHAQTERQLEQSGMGYTHLRPSSFMQNFLQSAGTIQSQSAIYAPIGDAKISYVDVRDIAAVAVKTLTEPGHEGKTYIITGPESLSHTDIAEKLSKALGKKVNFVDLPPEAYKQAVMGAGVPEWLADGLNELYTDWRTGSIAAVSSVVSEVAKKQPISFDQFARDHAAAFLK
ncbi:MAG: SDR family oxidoreductase [Acidobacteriota bacterium]|nr:SDR family oxidoreductase [Acidobacteriota bacterium]